MRLSSAALLSRLYDRNEATGAYIIKIAVDHYSDFFNEWDPAPFRRRDLDQDLINYLQESSEDIPLKHPLELQIDMPGAEREPELELRVRDGLDTYFDFVMLSLKKSVEGTYKRAMLYAGIFAACISSSLYLSRILPEHIVVDTFIEGLSIGGWVFLWEALDRIAFKNRETRQRIRMYKRLEEAPIRFRYIE